MWSLFHDWPHDDSGAAHYNFLEHSICDGNQLTMVCSHVGWLSCTFWRVVHSTDIRNSRNLLRPPSFQSWYDFVYGMTSCWESAGLLEKEDENETN